MRSPLPSLANLLFGQTRGRVLAVLYGAPDESFFMRQIARQIDTSAGAVQRELGILADAGLIQRSTLGNQVFYRANREHPVFPELRTLVAKTTGIFHLLGTALAPLAPRIEYAFVYGSVARGEETATSDIDLMVVGSVTLDEVLDSVAPIEKLLGRPVNPTIYSAADFEMRLRSGNHFLRSLQQSEKFFLIGKDDEYGKAGSTRLVQS